MFRLLNGSRAKLSARSYRKLRLRTVNIAETFSEELKMELYLHRHYNTQELVARFTARNGESSRPTARLAIAKLLFGLDKTVEDAERCLREGILSA